MKFHTLTRRAVTAGAASALVAGALVGATSPAQAAPVTNSYTCTGPTGPFPVTLDSDIPGVEAFPTIPAGTPITAGLLTVTNTFTVPSAVITTAQGFGITQLAASDFAGTIGATTVEVQGIAGNLADATDLGTGFSTFDADGTNAAFRIPRAGSYDVLSPESFAIDAKNAEGATAFSIPCVLADGTSAGAYHHIKVTKSPSTTTAKAVNSPIHKGDVAKVRVKVTTEIRKATGKVVLKRGTKTIAKGTLNKKGIVVLKTRALRVGKNRLVAQYKGDGYNKASSDRLVFKVRR